MIYFELKLIEPDISNLPDYKSNPYKHFRKVGDIQSCKISGKIPEIRSEKNHIIFCNIIKSYLEMINIDSLIIEDKKPTIRLLVDESSTIRFMETENPEEIIAFAYSFNMGNFCKNKITNFDIKKVVTIDDRNQLMSITFEEEKRWPIW